MSIHDRTLAVIEGFYDAALDETRWPGALKNLADLTDSQAASFWVLDGSETPRLPTFICINFDLAAIKEYLEHTASIDPTVQYLVAHPLQPIVHDGLVISEREKDRHPYYDWHERLIDTRFRMVGQARLMPSVQAGVALHRTRKAGRYEPKDIRRFEVLHNHLERALAIGFKLGSLGAMNQFSVEWLERSDSAVLLLDDRKRILFANRSAQSIESHNDGIRMSPGRITLARKADNDKLQSLIARALLPIASPAAPGAGVMRAARPSGKKPYGISVIPVSRKYPAFTLFRPTVCIIITDPDAHPSLSSETLQRAFGLTGAEARMAALLANGEELKRAAEQLQITYGTARARLAEIFQKTGTRRQTDLLRLLLTTLMAS